MQKGLGKEKPRGKDRGKVKSKLKKNRCLEEKKNKKRAEVKRLNSEKRKEKDRGEELKNLVSRVEIIGFEGGMFTVRVEGKEQKRALKIGKDPSVDIVGNLEIKLFGVYSKVSELKGFEGVAADVEEYLEK